MVVVYVEGGGDSVAQRAPMRRALGQFIERAIPGARKIRVEAWGGREQTCEKFCLAVATEPDTFHVLLVDSEAPVKTASRWAHVQARDRWKPPEGTDEDNLHFMAQTMEAWLCADPEALATYFKSGFNAAKLPVRENLEAEPKDDLNTKLAAATRDSKRGVYRKGRDLELLGSVAPDKVRKRCPSAPPFLKVLEERR